MKNSFALVLLFLSCGLYAQRSFSLKEAVALGLERNYNIELSDIDRQVAANNVTMSDFMPSVSLNGRANGENLSQNEIYKTEADIKRNFSTDQLYGDATLNWRVFDGMSMFASYDTKKELLSQGEINLKNSIENFLVDVSSQYYYLVTEKNRLNAAQYYMEISTERYNQAKEKYLIGSISGLEMKQAKIDLNADSSALVKLQTTFKNAVITFNAIINESLSQHVVLTDSIVLDGSLDLFDLLHSSEVRNSAVELARGGQRISHLNLRIARASQYPTLDAIASYRYNRSSSGLQAPSYTKLNGVAYGLTLSVPLFNGFETRRNIRDAKLGIERNQTLYEMTLQNVSSNIMQSYNNYNLNFQMINFVCESAEAAFLNLEAAREMYRIGTLSGIEFREIQRSYLQAEELKLNAIYEAKISEINLLYLSGKIMDKIK